MSEVVTEFEPLASERGMSLIVSGEGVPPVLADRTRLKQVITNLVSNAIKYGSEKGAVMLNQKLEEGHVRISVSNLGKGIPREQQKQVFEKYFRADSGSKIIGTGLGLYITKQLVEKMEGTISFTSVPDGETTFSFTLRVAKS